MVQERYPLLYLKLGEEVTVTSKSASARLTGKLVEVNEIGITIWIGKMSFFYPWGAIEVVGYEAARPPRYDEGTAALFETGASPT